VEEAARLLSSAMQTAAIDPRTVRKKKYFLFYFP